MPDLHGALVSFQAALQKGELALSKCAVHKDLQYMIDDAGGTPRITYARVIDGTVQAIVVFLPVEAYQKQKCMQVGYAVAPQFRKRGIAAETLKQSLVEIQNGFKNKMKSFFVEAVVSVDNIASKKIAERIISPEYKQIADKASGQPALQFFRRITT